MNITTHTVSEQLAKQLQPTFLEVVDESAQHAGHAGSDGTGEGTHFRVRIASAQFDGRPRVAKHRLVYDAMQELIDQGLHALAIEILDNPT